MKQVILPVSGKYKVIVFKEHEDFCTIIQENEYYMRTQAENKCKKNSKQFKIEYNE